MIGIRIGSNKVSRTLCVTRPERLPDRFRIVPGLILCHPRQSTRLVPIAGFQCSPRDEFVGGSRNRRLNFRFEHHNTSILWILRRFAPVGSWGSRDLPLEKDLVNFRDADDFCGPGDLSPGLDTMTTSTTEVDGIRRRFRPAPDKIREYRLQTRPFERLEIPGVALKPGGGG